MAKKIVKNKKLLHGLQLEKLKYKKIRRSLLMEHHKNHQMTHDTSGKLPEGIKTAQHPKYPLDTKVILDSDHMQDMIGAEATVVGVFDTHSYAVTYTDTDSGMVMENHRWVIQEETKKNSPAIQVGDTIVIQTDHMSGMDGATATVDEVIDEPIYMVDYISTETGEVNENHKWVSESEIRGTV